MIPLNVCGQQSIKVLIKDNKKIVKFAKPMHYSLLSDVLKNNFKKRDDVIWSKYKTNKYIEKYSRSKDGLNLEFADVLVFKSEQMVKSVEGLADIIISTENQLVSRSSAMSIAKEFIECEDFIQEETEKSISLVYMRKYQNGKFDSEFRKAYKMIIYGSKPFKRQCIYIDANNGEVLFNYSLINDNKNVSKESLENKNFILQDSSIEQLQPGQAYSFYSGVIDIDTYEENGVYYQKNLVRGGGIYAKDMDSGSSYISAIVHRDGDNIWNSSDIEVRVGSEVLWAQILFYDYFDTVFSRNSIDSEGKPLLGYYNTNLVSLGYPDNDNAFWDGANECVTFGKGSNFSQVMSLDIVAHEFAHGLTQFTCGLVYNSESGAINESLSDIWACVIESKYAPEKNRYIIGEEIISSGLRSMSDPSSKGYPEFYKGENWENTSVDHYGVHTNSSVGNFWFYLLSEGGSGTNQGSRVDNGTSYYVRYDLEGIGIEKAAEIVYNTQVDYLTSFSNYSDFRRFTVEVAISIYGVDSEEVEQVRKAWDAVGVNSDLYSYISGPNKATNSGTYSWDAIGSGGKEPYLYNWSMGYNGLENVVTSTNPSFSCAMPYDYDIELNLTVTDALGDVSYSSLHVLNLGDDNSEGKPVPTLFSISPNPINSSQLRMIAGKDYSKGSYIVICNDRGYPIYNFKLSKIKKNSELFFDVPNLSSGFYILNLYCVNGETQSIPFLVK
ncbi:M4 family metallopeptidase [Halosquirtibacter xylanolyticus]|uniref:M4 family metallopeptidase n=1 Tax=Halosquirtibacter xylanolyticus TaxID=3374599 RepID=UPI003747EE4E|nr:M4 family metallopeptidase [Prolixibacteraceae bacterium]